MLILAIESSCDETSAAVTDGVNVLSNIVASQADTHALYGGVVPEIASRLHCECISDVVCQALEKAEISPSNLDAVAVTYAPGLVGALLVGVNFAKAYAYQLGIPLIPVHHLKGHIAANYIENPDLQPPFICLVVSGGHTSIIDVRSHTDFCVLGQTRDDAAGEAFDKVARVLGLPYPGGASIDNLAKQGNPLAVSFPRVKMENPYDFSFSGVKTSVLNFVHNAQQKGASLNHADTAASFSDAVCGVLAEKTVRAALDKGCGRAAVCGGVAANSMLRHQLSVLCEQAGLKLYMPSVAYCGDNAAMIGVQASFEFLSGRRAPLSLNAYATMDLEEDNMFSNT